jgi:aspartyl-tRNA(Asn)/glutamyl-tRNA(Gln) amidotransferase subunit B
MNRCIVIGLEVHVQLSCNTKIFSGSSTNFGAAPNSQACEIDLGLPGTLPNINVEAMNKAIMFGFATKSKINERNVFARKNYFYPDLPKGYQITQHHAPILVGGEIEIGEGENKQIIRIHHSHLEEDAGKSLHGADGAGIDLNRAGQPLLEIVSMPDMFSVEDAISYLKKLHHLVTYLGICDGNMQEGSFRCDANISLRDNASAPFGTRVEIKNLNSFKFIEKALKFEIKRQNALLDKNEEIIQETRLYHEETEQTRSMRKKEDSHDYRYFPEPDLPTIMVNQEHIDEIKKRMPVLPAERIMKYCQQWGLSDYDANVLVSVREIADFFDQVMDDHSRKLNAKLVANWIIGQLLSLVNKHQILFANSPIGVKDFADLMRAMDSNEISQSAGKLVLEQLWEKVGNVPEIIKQNNLAQVSDETALREMIQAVIDDHPTQLEEYRSGKDKLFGFFVGKAMAASKGKANPSILNEILKSMLSGN